MSKRFNFNQNSGFTLIEIMIALVLMSFISIAIFTITTNNLDTKDMVVDEDRAFFQSYGAFDRMNRDLEQLWSPYYYDAPKTNTKTEDRDQYSEDLPANDFIVRESFQFATTKNHPVPNLKLEDKTTIQFLTSSHQRRIEGQKESVFAWVEYSLENYEGDKEAFKATQVLKRKIIATDIYKADLDWDKIKGQVLLKGIKELKYEFWSPKLEKWIDDMRQLAPLQKFAPLAIKMTIKWIDSNEVEKSSIRVFRPLWPFFDVVEDNKLREAAKKPKSNGSGSNSGSTSGSTSQGNSTGTTGGNVK
ncbi:prepilin-type N-terminal cleavage/methylation domain-containing protein [Bacteriovoracaceae bacterium]|nr:prepilin-type N-terminal cleavage/methylation domain-containing protein [Bacteriovoracaceae bacterium]